MIESADECEVTWPFPTMSAEEDARWRCAYGFTEMAENIQACEATIAASSAVIAQVADLLKLPVREMTEPPKPHTPAPAGLTRIASLGDSRL